MHLSHNKYLLRRYDLVLCFLLVCPFFFWNKEFMKACTESVEIEVYLMNGQKVALDIKSTDRTDDVLEVSHS